MIRGITHDKDGRPKVRRSITTKLAIGLPPDGGRNYPTKLDHIAFLKKVYLNKEIQWVPDDQLTEHYKENCRELWITFLDDDIEAVFPTKWGAYVTRGLWCTGDGETAQRRPKHEKEWNAFEPFSGKCANGGCPIAESGDCKPNGTLYFFLRDFPKLGSLCKLQTTGFQSIQQLYSALQDLRSVTGGRLQGISAKLFIHPDKTVYEQNGSTKTGMKWCWGLELAATDLADMGTRLLESAKAFREIRGELSGRVLELEEDETEVAQEMRAEFYPPAGDARVAQPPSAVSGGGNVIEMNPAEQKLKDELHELLTAVGMNQANRLAVLGGVSPENLPELAQSIKQIIFIFRAKGEPMLAAGAITKNARRLAIYAKEVTDWYEKKKQNGSVSAEASSPQRQPAPIQSGPREESPVRSAAGPEQQSLHITDADAASVASPAAKSGNKRFAF